VNASAFAGHYYQITEKTCVNFLGIKFSPFLLFDWVATVPFLFFLTSMLDINKTKVNQDDIKREVLSGISLIFAALTHFNLFPIIINIILMIISLILMTIVLLWQFFASHQEFYHAKHESESKMQHGLEHFTKEIYDTFCITQAKYSLATFILFAFTLFPSTYFLRAWGVIDDDVCCVILFGLSLVTKFFYIQIVGDTHIELLDPHKFLLLEEKKKAAESRLMFLRYVFHEVRVPLNSISLGLQLLDDSSWLHIEDKETITMMTDATKFMAETLNDVLSLQKIEEGKLHLEMKAFSPDRLVTSVVNTFR
jgi:signal transduction histidine kinase